MLTNNKRSRFSATRVVILIALFSTTLVTFASIGGEKLKNRKGSLSSVFKPLKTSTGFSLKSGLNYRGTMILKEVKTNESVSYSSLIRYQKGNATYILPNHYKIALTPNAERSNLQMVNLKIKLCK
jgi:nucleoside permease NupC